MGKINSATVQRVLDAANIVDVVSDFVVLKRRGANLVGLCPFHNDRSPSFYVSKAKNLCKCFACGEGGSPVNFVMKHEQMTFHEAIRYLGKKYNIEVEEREMTEEERRAETRRESLMAVNEFAMKYFEKYLTDSDEGRDVGGSYFRYRGLSEATIKQFHLGFAPEGKDTFYREAVRRGYSDDYLVATGLVSRTDDGRVYDRFRGRVIYPIFSLSGKPVAFGGRTLKKEKTLAKYVNSPESEIYSKRRELYGLFQAKGAIVKAEKVYLVEGYMDVLSMAQAGICNVVASSGTALTIEQVRLIHRFTKRVTLIYDSDAAGIKASIRGIDLLLREGLDIKVLLLPEGEDPDSFAQSHPSSEVEAYIAANEQDFVTFIANLRLRDARNDPATRADAITHIVRTIALIPDEIRRSVYIQECARLLGQDEGVLRRAVGRYFNEYAQAEREERQRQAAAAERQAGATATPAPAQQPPRGDEPPEFIPDEAFLPDPPSAPADPAKEAEAQAEAARQLHARTMRPAETELMRFVVRYANYLFATWADEDNNVYPLSVIDYVSEDLAGDDVTLSNPDLALLFEAAREVASDPSYGEHLQAETERLQAERDESIRRGIEAIRAEATDIGQIKSREMKLTEEADAAMQRGIDDFQTNYVGRQLCSAVDDTVRHLATELLAERYQLSKVHTKYAAIPTERDLLRELVPRALLALKDAIIKEELRKTTDEMKQCGGDPDKVRAIFARISELQNQRRELGKLLGDRVVAPMR